MANKLPLLSVIIPAYNEEGYIKQCLESLIKQDIDHSLYEIIVVDNASTDKTAGIIKKYPVKYLYEPRRSVVIARQKGVDNSKGEIIVSGDADTIYSSKWLSKINNDFEDNPELIALVGWIYFKNTSTFFNLTFALWQQINFIIQKYNIKPFMVFAANFAFKRWALNSIGGYPTYLPELGDQQYLLHKFRKIGKIKIDKKVYCFTSSRRQHSKVKNVFIYNGWYRLVGYLVNRMLGREVIGPAPAIRTIPPRKSH